MKILKASAASGLVLAAAAMLVPGTIMAAHGHKHHAHKNHGHHVVNTRVEVGTVSAYTAGSSLTVNGVAIKLTAKTKLVAEDSAATTAGLTVGDDAAVFVRWHKGAALATRVEFGTVAFPYLRKDFLARYESSTTTSITVALRGRKPVVATFVTDANTKYYDNGTVTTTPSFAANDKLTVRGEEFVDGAWYAASVRLHHRAKASN